VHSTVQRHQSAERPILRQISSLMYPNIQRKQVIMNVLHPGCVWPPRWSPPVLWRKFEDGLASICHTVRYWIWNGGKVKRLFRKCRSKTRNAVLKKAVIDRRLRPLCCYLWGYFKHTSFSCRYIRMDIVCKHDVMNIQHTHYGLVGPDCKK